MVNVIYSNIGYVVVVTLSIVLAIVLVARGKTVQTKLFSAISLLSATWIAFNFLADNSRTYESALLWSRVAILPTLYIGPLFATFAYVFPGEEQRFSIRKLIVLLCTTVPFLFFIPTAANVQSVEILENGINYSPGWLYIVFGIYLGVFLLYSFILLIKKYIELRGVLKSQVAFLGIGMAASFLTAILATLVLPLLGYTELSFIGPISPIFFTMATTYSLLRHRLFGMKFVLGRTLFILLVSLIPYAWFFAVYFFQTELWGSVYSIGSLISGFLISIAFVYFLLFARNKISNFIESKIINVGFNPQKMIEEVGEKLGGTLDLLKVAGVIVDALKKTYNSDVSSLVLISLDARSIILNKPELNNIDSGKLLSFCAKLSKILSDPDTAEPIILEEVILAGSAYRYFGSKYLNEVVDFMKNNSINTIFPLNRKTQAIGYVFLGSKSDNSLYNSQDLDFVRAIVLSASVAIGRALLYEEVQQFGAKLQKEVDIATKKLKVQNEQLKELDKMKDDLISIAGHELRTPATVAKGNLYLLKKKFNSPDRRKYLERATDAIEREAELVTILLEASRIGKDTLELIVEPLQLEQLAKEAVEDHKSSAEKKGLKLTFIAPKAPLSQIYGDKTRIREIADNLITNAVKYTEKGSIEVWTEEKNQQVWVHVKDTGVGIPENEIPNLFQKFYRVKNYTSGTKHLLRPGGTGLGLYVSKNLAKRHGGDVTVESEIDVGSTFSFYIPLSFKGNLGAVKDLPHGESEADLFKAMGLSHKRKSNNARPDPDLVGRTVAPMERPPKDKPADKSGKPSAPEKATKAS